MTTMQRIQAPSMNINPVLEGGDHMQVIGYTRVSTDEQAREGISLQAQREKILAWASALDFDVIALEEDAGISGKNIRAREGLKRALELACSEKAALVVYSLSRLSRSTRDTLMVAEMLDVAGADLVSLSERIDTSSAAGKMVFRMLAVLNEFERDQISHPPFFSTRRISLRSIARLPTDTTETAPNSSRIPANSLWSVE